MTGFVANPAILDDLKAQRNKLERDLTDLNQDLLHNLRHPGPRGVFYNDLQRRAIAQKQLEIDQVNREIRELKENRGD